MCDRSFSNSTIAVVLILFATVVNAAPASTNKYINDARKQVAGLIADHFNRCLDGDYYARQAGLYHRPIDFIYQVRGIQVEVGPDGSYMPLGEVDRANGYRWRGAFSISARMTRRYHDGSWDDWEPNLFGQPAYVHVVGLQNDSWYVEQIFDDVMGYRGLPLLPLPCSSIPSGNNSQSSTDKQAAQERELRDAAKRYITTLSERVQRAWIRPPSVRAELDCLVSVTQVFGGEVTSAKVTTCNGDAMAIASIENAVYRASPLPDPPDPSLFEQNLTIRFHPDE